MEGFRGLNTFNAHPDKSAQIPPLSHNGFSALSERRPGPHSPIPAKRKPAQRRHPCAGNLLCRQPPPMEIENGRRTPYAPNRGDDKTNAIGEFNAFYDAIVSGAIIEAEFRSIAVQRFDYTDSEISLIARRIRRHRQGGCAN
ncbi:hypothetical protein LQG66_09490 [Bradyrhizobium ontarionense]|uniref:Uncharacterized protein n=1 Tax=Bradyrhizobium ontarionense TaxID=2898149 RepID=A0ABY3RGC1_9BRAD|nr:hypothetical protein [Bradyrhizobium sp. A19]UFZ06504.1 hypothetical protein LQG66_09490 [Bradyrhizobium sp. A19]